MTSNAAALPLPGWRDPLDKILKRLADGLGRRASGLTRLEKIARRVPCRPTSPAYAAACLEVLETRVNCRRSIWRASRRTGRCCFTPTTLRAHWKA